MIAECEQQHLLIDLLIAVEAVHRAAAIAGQDLIRELGLAIKLWQRSTVSLGFTKVSVDLLVECLLKPLMLEAR